ncbi:MAG: hypothetical protein EBR82_35295 [Caulobacteraceae bacterium]|jgi:hypothetical protein|nr:hypothetical protein [Caulobacteraceae bacterium]
MAFSNTFDTTNPGSAVSNREDLLDVLTILAPEETPVLSSAPKSKASATFVEWTVDSLSAPVTTGVAEGSDVTAFTDKFAGRARLGNYVQKFRRDFMVSDLQNAVDSVGPAKIAQAEAKAVREIKRDIEATLMSNNDRSVEDGGSTVYGLRGLGDWIDSAGPADVPAAYRTPAASISSSGAITETVFNNLITSIYRVTGTTNSLTLVADTALRRVISDYARTSGSSDYSVRQVTYNGEVSTIKLAVEMYESDHGMVSIVNMNPDCAPDTSNKDTGYLINPDYYGVAELISLGSTRLPNLGGGDRGYVDSTLTLLVKHPGAHGKITAIA